MPSRRRIQIASAFHNRSFSLRTSDEVKFDRLEPRTLLASVSSATFEFDTAPQRIVYELDEPIAASITVADITVDNLGTPWSAPFTIDPSDISVTALNASTVEFTFPGVQPAGMPPSVLPDGNYLTELFPPQWRKAHEFPFFFLHADGSRDRQVTATPDYLQRVGQNFGLSPATFSQGNYNFDAAVNIQDFALYNSQAGKVLPPALGYPEMPESVSASFAAGQVTVQWLHRFSTVDYYQVQRSLDSGQMWGPSQDVNAPTASYADPDPAPESFPKRLYRVRIVDHSGAASAWSDPVTYTLQAEQSVQVFARSDNGDIMLSWPAYSTQPYSIYRRTLPNSTWVLETTLPVGSDEYLDENVSPGIRYEYKIATGNVYGYAVGAVELAAQHDRGKLLLLIDQTQFAPLANEIQQLQLDLVGAGYIVEMQVTPRENPANKHLVRDVKEDFILPHADGLDSILIIGHVPVPYSGTSAYDGHFDHAGAWSTDTYYGDLVDEVGPNRPNMGWVDIASVGSLSNYQGRNYNQPNDGKWDNTYLPSALEASVGRVDFAESTIFENHFPGLNYETELLRRYLNKAHDYRNASGDFEALPTNGLIDNEWGSLHNAGVSGWRTAAALLGWNNVAVGDYVDSNNPFPVPARSMWAFGGGPGSRHHEVGPTWDYWYEALAGVVASRDMPYVDAGGIFNLMFGSYIADFDFENSMLRNQLASRHSGLAAIATYDHAVMHGMALGDTIGDAVLVTQNNNAGLATGYAPVGFNTGGTPRILTSLMGDPTLRQHVVAPPTNLVVEVGGAKDEITWDESADPQVLGYHVYFSTAYFGPYELISGDEPIQDHYFSYSEVPPGTVGHYMVRAVKLQEDPVGTYYNLSQGIFGPSDQGRSAPPSMPGSNRATSPMTARPTATTFSAVRMVDELAELEML